MRGFWGVNPGSNREIRLQRGAMPRLIQGVEKELLKPRGVILGVGLSENIAYFLHEEEVSRAGSQISRSFQRTRCWDGQVYTWLGRRKQTKRGQGSSGLTFDSFDGEET